MKYAIRHIGSSEFLSGFEGRNDYKIQKVMEDGWPKYEVSNEDYLAKMRGNE